MAEPIQILLEKFIAGTVTERERAELLQRLEAGEGDGLVGDFVANTEAEIDMSPETAGQILDAIFKAGKKQAPVRRIQWWKYSAAAVFIAAMVFTGRLLVDRNKPAPVVAAVLNVPAPATNRATVTLGNGRTVYLDSAGSGQLANQNGVRLMKLGDGSIRYEGALSKEASKTEAIAYNTVTNPLGSKAISIELPDHSQSWLNAGSSVTFPVAFTGSSRRLRITGELYFEVVHNTSMPFIVEKGNTSVTVYGTHFNVKAYDNEPDIKVTLLEGSVSVTKGNTKQMLKPGQQAVVKAENIQLIESPDTEQAVAWKNGSTSFHSADIETVLRELERWYNISTEVRGEPKTKSFFTEAPRSAPLQDVLKSIFDDNNIRYEYDADKRKLTIL